MIKSIVEKIMIKEFSKYINGIEYNKLTIEVLGGYFSIENISLNQDFFNSLETPFIIAYSHIGKLSIQAPLTKLSSVPVSCTIQDVYVIVELKKHAKNLSEIPKEQLLTKYIRQSFELLLNKIKQANKQEGMIDKLGKKVIDNLKFQVKNIHIRFQESNVLHSYSFGVSLKSLTFGTTDKNWEPIFVERDKVKEEEPIYKRMQIQNFKIYWQSIDRKNQKQWLFLKKQTSPQRIQAMRKYVSIDQDSIININSMVKLKINPSSLFNEPLIELEISLQPINIKFSQLKIVQVLDFTTSCIKHNEIMLKTLLEKATKKISSQHQRKIKPLCQSFVQHILVNEGSKPQKNEKQKQLNKIISKYQQMFNTIQIQTLYEWSLHFIKDIAHKRREKQLKKQKKGWFSSAEVQLTPEEKRQLQKLLNELTEDRIAGKGRPSQCIMFRLKIKFQSISLYFYNQNTENDLKTIEIKIQEIVCNLEKSKDKSWFSVQSRIKKLTADLEIEEKKVAKKIKLMQNINEGKNQPLIEFVYRQSVKVDKKTEITYYSDCILHKTLFTYKKEYWKMFKSFFSLPEIDQQLQNEAIGKLQLLNRQGSDDESAMQIDKQYHINLCLQSPSFILPLSGNTCWYLDLGNITMKSQMNLNQFIYPFKLRKLNMRFINLVNQQVNSQSVMNFQEFFPIIKDINVDLSMVINYHLHTVHFNVQLQKIQLSATRQQFVNFLNIKKFLLGEESEQLKNLHEQLKTKSLIKNKAKITSKLLKRRKYLHSWVQYQAFFYNNSIYLYLNEKEVFPESVISLRAIKLEKHIDKIESQNPIFELQLRQGQEIIYLQFQTNRQLQDWQAEINKAKRELKDKTALLLQREVEHPKKHKAKPEDLISLNLNLRELTWNYLNQKGKSFLKIQLQNFNFTAVEKEQKVVTMFQVSDINIYDKMFEYNNQKYQHLFKSQNLSWQIEKVKEKITKITTVQVQVSIGFLNINWKPDVLLLIIQSYKEFIQVKPLSRNRGKSKDQVLEEVRNDKNFNKFMKQYDTIGLEKEIKSQRAQYLKMRARPEQIYLKFQTQIKTLSISFIHRQSHMPMFSFHCGQLITNVTLAEGQKFVDGAIQQLQIFEISGYPQKKYDINEDYAPFCLISKQNSSEHLNALSFKYSAFQPQEIPNKQRVDSILSLNFSPLTINYFQEVFLRLIDYLQIQILMLLNDFEMITVNEDILKQLNQNENSKIQKPKTFLEDTFETVLKKYFNPYFLDLNIVLVKPQVILAPTKNYRHYFSLNFDEVVVSNRQFRSQRRFSNIRYDFMGALYEDQMIIKGTNIVLQSINNQKISRLTDQNFDCEVIVNRLLFEDEINEIKPEIEKYDRAIKIRNQISRISMPELSKLVYQNLVRLPNFNFNFEDLQNELFIHNYKITKTLSPRPIQYFMTVAQIATTAQHSLDNQLPLKLKLFKASVKEFVLSFKRDQKLNSTVQINIESVLAYIYEFDDFEGEPKQKILGRISKPSNKPNSCLFIIKLPTNGKIDIQAVIQEAQLFPELGVLPLIADWVQLQQSVFPQSSQKSRFIHLLMNVPSIVVNLQSAGLNAKLKTKGQLVLDMTRFDGYSQNYLREGHLKKQIKPEYIQSQKQFLVVKVSLGFQFFSRYKNKDRKLVDKTKIQFREHNFFKIRNNLFRKTAIRKLMMSKLQGSISIDDFILLKGIAQNSKQSALYEQRCKELLQSQFSKSQSQNQAIVYKDIFKDSTLLQEMVFKVQSIKLYMLSNQNKELIPIFRAYLSKCEVNEYVNTSNQVFSGDFALQISYFNDKIFRWQPLIQTIYLKPNIMKNNQTHRVIEVDVTNQIYINLSKENAISIKKFTKIIQNKIQRNNKGQYQLDQACAFVSRFSIRNKTGYPLQIFNKNNASEYVIPDQQTINYTSKAIVDSFFEENKIEESISFAILHPKQEFLKIQNIALQSQKSFDIDLYTAKGIKMPPSFGLYLQNQVQGCKKILTIRSKKCVTDYSSNTLIKRYYPFDHQQSVVLSDNQHKGFKASFFKKLQTERFIYNGYNGNLVIRKKYLVYNYTMIPLKVTSYYVVPGEFVGINQPLTIQGLSYQQSYLKVVYNQRKSQFYIYSICYLIDYTNLSITFYTEDIKELYSYRFSEKGREATIYLLPDIDTSFTVKAGKNSSSQRLLGKLTRQNFTLTVGNEIWNYSSFGRLESFCEQNIKDFKKIIEITNSFTICNDTPYNIIYNQSGHRQKPTAIKPNQSYPFKWFHKELRQTIDISIEEEREMWYACKGLPITKETETFIIRSKKNQAKFVILGLQLEETNNITFIHLVDASKKIEIMNAIPHSTLNIYQTVIFQNKNIPLEDPANYIYQLKYNARKSFGYQLPLLSHQATVQLQLQSDFYSWRCPSFAIDDMQNNLIDKEIEQKAKGKDLPHKIVISLQFINNTKVVKFSFKKHDIFKKSLEFRVNCKIKTVSLSLIGFEEELRKQILNISLGSLILNYYQSQKYIETSLSVKSLRIQNTLKAEPYFISLFRQAEESNKPALLFALRKSSTNPRVIYYVGFSLLRSVVSVTSSQLQILQENISGILQSLNQKSDIIYNINIEQIFTPKLNRSDQKIYFAEAELHPLRLIMTYKHVNNWGGTLLKALSINECKIKVDGKKITNFVSPNLLDFFSNVGAHFKEGLSNQIFSMIGSLAILGSPLNLASKIGCGIQNLITLPADGFQDEGVLGVGKGLALGAGSLVSNTVEGAFGSVQSITGTIGNGISGLASYDKDFNRRRQQIKNERVQHVGEGLLSGGKSIVNGLFTGITGFVTEPFKGAEKQGFGGFIKGGFKGLTGLIVKPVSGVIDATSKTAEGIKNTTKVFSKETKQLKTRKYNPRPFYSYEREIRSYDKNLAEWNKQLTLYQAKYENLSWAGIYELRNGETLILTYEYILIIRKGELEIEKEFNSSELQAVGREAEKLWFCVSTEEKQNNKVAVDAVKREECFSSLKRIYSFYKKNYEIGIEKSKTMK